VVTGLSAVVAIAVVVGVVAFGRGGASDEPARARAWLGRYGTTARAVLVAVNGVPVDTRAAGPAGMAAACVPLARATGSMRAALPAPDPRLARAWSAVAHDVGVVAGFCIDAAARRDVTMLGEVPNYLALTAGAFERLRVVMASYGPSL